MLLPRLAALPLRPAPSPASEAGVCHFNSVRRTELTSLNDAFTRRKLAAVKTTTRSRGRVAGRALARCETQPPQPPLLHRRALSGNLRRLIF